MINPTGVLLHTNLGRSPITINRPPRYSNLEFDLQSGTRGTHDDPAGPRLIAMIAGAESGLIVNNGAAELRPGGLVLEALHAVALAYLRRDAASIPFWWMRLHR